MRSNLSTEAQTALINAGTNRQGTVIRGTAGVLAELYANGLIADHDGLTRSGTIERERVMAMRMEEMFG